MSRSADVPIVAWRAPAMAPNRERNYVGVIPAAGQATRLSPLPEERRRR